MKDTRKYSVYPSNLDFISAFQSLLDTLKGMAFQEDLDVKCDQVGYTVTLAGDRRLRAYTYSEFLDVLRKFPHPHTIWSHGHWKSKNTGFSLDVDITSSGIDIGISGELAVILGLHDAIRDVFRASNPEPERSPALTRYNLKKSIFLAHRFDDEGNTLAGVLSTFLVRLGFHVLEGEGYESRDIPSKVADRIRSQDIFILVGTPGDTSWILSEAGFAKGLDKYLVILAQNGVPLNKGLIGADHEHIAFPKGMIEKAFNDLLYALPR